MPKPEPAAAATQAKTSSSRQRGAGLRPSTGINRGARAAAGTRFATLRVTHNPAPRGLESLSRGLLLNGRRNRAPGQHRKEGPNPRVTVRARLGHEAAGAKRAKRRVLIVDADASSRKSGARTLSSSRRPADPAALGDGAESPDAARGSLRAQSGRADAMRGRRYPRAFHRSRCQRAAIPHLSLVSVCR